MKVTQSQSQPQSQPQSQQETPSRPGTPQMDMDFGDTHTNSGDEEIPIDVEFTETAGTSRATTSHQQETAQPAQPHKKQRKKATTTQPQGETVQVLRDRIENARELQNRIGELVQAAENPSVAEPSGVSG